MKQPIICQLSDFCPEYPGSFVDSLLALSRHCREELNLETLCIFPEQARNRGWLKKFEDEKITCAFLPAKKNFALSLTALLREFEPLIFHCHFVTFDLSAIILKLLKYRRTKVVWHLHGLTTFNVKQRTKDVVKIRFVGRIFTDRFIAVSDGVGQNASERGIPKGKLVTNYNGINIQRFVPSANERERAREALGVSSQHTVFLHLGYDPFIKGVDVFVKASAAYAKLCAGGKALFLIIGRERTKEYVAKMSESSELTGSLRVIDPIEDFPSLLNGVDVLVSSSRSEGFGYAIFEAMTSNKIVLCSDIPGMRETCGESEGVWMFPSEDWHALSDLMESVDELTVGARERLGRVNAQFVAEHYSLEGWAHRMGEIYKSLLAH